MEMRCPVACRFSVLVDPQFRCGVGLQWSDYLLDYNRLYGDLPSRICLQS